MSEKPQIFNAGSFLSYGSLAVAKSVYSVKERSDLLGLLPHKNFKSMIEFGCADCTNLFFFAKELDIQDTVGVDNCKPTSFQADKVTFIHQTVEAFLESNKRSFDLVLLSDVLEHLYNPWAVLHGIKKILTAEGVLLISVPNFENIRYAQSVLSGHFFYEETGLMDQTHIRFFSKNTLLFYLQMSGFKTIATGFRPDHSLFSLKNLITDRLRNSDGVYLNLDGSSVFVTVENIERKFGQQVLVAAQHV